MTFQNNSNHNQDYPSKPTKLFPLQLIKSLKEQTLSMFTLLKKLQLLKIIKLILKWLQYKKNLLKKFHETNQSIKKFQNNSNHNQDYPSKPTKLFPLQLIKSLKEQTLINVYNQCLHCQKNYNCQKSLSQFQNGYNIKRICQNFFQKQTNLSKRKSLKEQTPDIFILVKSVHQKIVNIQSDMFIQVVLNIKK
eukprot:TRINITY_DN1701_c0_g1_i1.p1 TRINITY_DN1701_c0_g1~~TRINITY_DN1701_c0_g1_i1.p1  ORF type:complete len:192 (+),score=-18.23 TRINITY_DN1701_c0_g1_i1:35-610(+)